MPLEDRFALGPENSSEAGLVERIRAGDPAAFEALYRRYWQALYAFAYRYVHSKEDAEEVVQDVFLRIWRRRAHWRPASPVRNYLYLAVRNAACDRLERAAVARRWRHAQGDAPGYEAVVEESELAAAVERALAELPPKRAAVCKLRLIDDLSYAQIADRLGIREKTVETQLARGLQFLRYRLRGPRLRAATRPCP